MSLKTKLITSLLLVSLLIITAATISSFFVINFRFIELEDRYALRNLDRINELINSNIASLSKTAKDYAYWDDTYNFIENKNIMYKESNLTQENLHNSLKLDFAFILDANKQSIFAWENQSTSSSNATIAMLISHYQNIFDQDTAKASGVAGFIETPSGLALVDIEPITRTNKTGDLNGWLIYGQYFNDTFIQQLAQIMKLDISLTANSLHAPILDRTLIKKADFIHGSLNIYDIAEQNVGVLQTTSVRDIYQETNSIFTHILIVVILTYLASAILIIVFGNWMSAQTIHRVKFLSQKAKSTAAHQFATPLNYASWENSHDELGELARSMEQMRKAAFEATQNLQTVVKEKTQALEEKLKKEEKASEAMIYLLDREKQHNRQLDLNKQDLEKITKELKQTNSNLEEANQIKNEFVNIATHQLKNPLVALIGFAQMLREGVYGELPAFVHEPLTQILGCTQQISTLISDMLKISRSEQKDYPVNIEEVNLMEVIISLKPSFESLMAQKQLKYLYQIPKLTPKVMADRERVKDVISNLVSNAIKYSEHGTITISHEFVGNKVITHIADEGFGISLEDQSKLFRRFFRTVVAVTKEIPGTGLGLYIVKEYLEKMKGVVCVDSVEGKGSVFSFSLPKAL